MEPALGAVPLDTEGSAWGSGHGKRPRGLQWAQQTRDPPLERGGARNLGWRGARLHPEVVAAGARGPRVEGPAGVRHGDAYASADVAPFAKALRQRVEAVIIHSAVTTLPSGVTATASVRRGRDGDLYSVTRPLTSQVDEAEDRRALQELENRVREGVGLPTR